MTAAPLTDADLDALRAFDTPTVCNALEALDQRWRTSGFTSAPLVCAHPDLPPIVGYARTATIRAVAPPPESGTALRDKRLAYYRYVEAGPRPSIAVIEDLDPPPGFGAYWGEVQTAVHKGLGCAGLVTNGSMRDLDDVAPGFQLLAGLVGPSHAWVHLVEVDVTVTVAGLTVRPGDLVHADRHGAAVIPAELAREVPKTAKLLARREAVILDAARAPGFTAEILAACFAEQDDIH